MSAVQGELGSSSLVGGEVTVSAAFTATKNRDGIVECDFLDTAAMSKPRPEEIHRLEVTVDLAVPELEVNESPFELDVPVTGGERPEEIFKKEALLDKPPVFRKLATPPALPPRRGLE